jgi:hypothetical protein
MRVQETVEAVRRHERLLWFLHSLYALAAGIVVMWIGAHHYKVLRYVFGQIAFIWATSLLLPWIDGHAHLGDRPRWWIRAVANYLNKDFYQQLLFFVLPVYYASATLDSWNIAFVILLAASATLASLDLIYDRHLASRPALLAAFFAFNVFACVNVALPVIWRISNGTAMWASAALAVGGFVTLHFRPAEWRGLRAKAASLTGAALIGVLVFWGRPIVPPAPLRLSGAAFGTAMAARGPILAAPVSTLAPSWSGELYAVTPIVAPLGLHERVRHRWYQDGRLIYTSPYYQIAGGRTEGYRLWTSDHVSLDRASRVRVDVETESGQLIGRARIRTGDRRP